MSLLGLIYKKKKKTQRANRVQWPSFLQAGMPVIGCHIGQSAASDFRAERAVRRVGGQMEGGCTAQPSSASFSLCWHTASLPSSLPVPCLFIYSFGQSSLSRFALMLSPRHFTARRCLSVVSLYLTDWKCQGQDRGVCKSD